MRENGLMERRTEKGCTTLRMETNIWEPSSWILDTERAFTTGKMEARTLETGLRIRSTASEGRRISTGFTLKPTLRMEK